MLKPQNILYSIPFAVMILLVILKSYSAPFTHDEAFSYLTFSSKSIKDILSFKVDTSANNHLFNTLFMKLIGSIGLQHPFYLRLLSTASILLFVYSLIQISKTESGNVSILLACIVCSSPYLLDFFSMARGYAFSFSLMAFSIYLLLKRDGNNLKFWSMQVATISMLSNFNLVYFWAALGLIHFIILIQETENTKTFLKACIINYLFPVLAFIYLYIVFSRLKEAQQLYFGGNTGIIENLVKDQLWCLIYDKNYEYNAVYLLIWQYLPVVMSLLAILFIAFKKIRSNQNYLDWIKVQSILFLAFALIELNHQVSGSLYPIKRTGLFMSILLGISLLLFFRFLVSYRIIKIPVLIIGIGLSGLLFYHTLSCYQAQRFREIPYDAHHEEILKTLENIKASTNAELYLSANWQLGPSLNFYKKTRNLDWLPETKRDPVDLQANYLLVFEEDIQQLDSAKMEILLRYDEDKLYLIKQSSK